MTIDERIAENPDFVYIKQKKQWKGQDVYEVLLKKEYEARKSGHVGGDDFGGGPSFLLVNKDGEVEMVLDLSERYAIGRAVGLIG